MVQIKITVIKTFSPEDVFGHEMKKIREEFNSRIGSCC